MSRGKKFDAAEKHFLKKEEAYRKKQKQFYADLDTAYTTINQLKKEIAELNEKLSAVTEERDEALKLSSMDSDEMRKHMEQTRKVAAMYGMLSAIRRY